MKNTAYGDPYDWNRKPLLGTLAEDQVINGKAYRKGDSLKFNEDGSIKAAKNIQDEK